MNEQQIWETLRDEPFGVEWSAWCHPETLRDLRDDCQSLRDKDDPIPHVPDDHPPASPELVEWESTSDYLDVDVTDTTWRWTMDYSDRDVATRAQFNYRVPHRDLLEMDEDHVMGAMNAFAERAIDTVNSTETHELTGWFTNHGESAEPRVATKPTTGEITETFEDVHKPVGEKTITYGDLSMQPRSVPRCR